MTDISKILKSSNYDFQKYLLQTLDAVKTICLCLKLNGYVAGYGIRVVSIHC